LRGERRYRRAAADRHRVARLCSGRGVARPQRRRCGGPRRLSEVVPWSARDGDPAGRSRRWCARRRRGGRSRGLVRGQEEGQALKLSEISISRPVMATVMSLGVLLFGILSLTRLPVREYPDVESPIVSVLTVNRGASP